MCSTESSICSQSCHRSSIIPILQVKQHIRLRGVCHLARSLSQDSITELSPKKQAYLLYHIASLIPNIPPQTEGWRNKGGGDSESSWSSSCSSWCRPGLLSHTPYYCCLQGII